MIRSGVASCIVAVLAACGNGSKPSEAPAGPVYLPSTANALRSVAGDCKLEKTPTSQRRDCVGPKGSVQILLGEGDHFQSLTISLRSMILPEAKARFDLPLQQVLGASGRDQVLAGLDKLDRGQSAILMVGKAKVTSSAGGTSGFAPEYTLVVEW